MTERRSIFDGFETAAEESASLTREDIVRMYERFSSPVIPASVAMGDGTKQLMIRTLRMTGTVVTKPKGLETFLGLTIVEDPQLAPGMVELRDANGRRIRMINLNENAP